MATDAATYPQAIAKLDISVDAIQELAGLLNRVLPSEGRTCTFADGASDTLTLDGDQLTLNNDRRLFLITKKYEKELSSAEAAELQMLQEEVMLELERLYPHPTEPLAEMERIARKHGIALPKAG